MDWVKGVDFSDPQKAVGQFQRILDEQQRQFQLQLDAQIQEVRQQQQQQVTEIETKYSVEFDKMKTQMEEQRKLLEEQRLQLENERVKMMEDRAALDKGNDSSRAKKNVIMVNGAPSKKRLCTGDGNRLLTEFGFGFVKNDKRSVIELNTAGTSATIPKITSAVHGASQSGDDEMDSGITTKNKADNAAGGPWQPVRTKAQKNSAKKLQKNDQRVTPIQLGKMETGELRNFGTNLIKEIGAEGIVLQRLGGKQNPRIVCETEESKRKVIDHLSANGVEFNSLIRKQDVGHILFVECWENRMTMP